MPRTTPATEQPKNVSEVAAPEAQADGNGHGNVELAEADRGVRPGHGTESFYIIGEGLLSEARGGRGAAPSSRRR